METIQLQVTGMTCGMCEQHVAQALNEVAGVNSSTVDLKAGSATVQHEGAKPGALLEAVAEAGYEAQIAPVQIEQTNAAQASCSCNCTHIGRE
jgi:copper chaperone